MMDNRFDVKINYKTSRRERFLTIMPKEFINKNI